MASVAASERLRRELEDVIGGAGEALDPIEAIGRLGARLILRQALEEELTDFLGRERYRRQGCRAYARARGARVVFVPACASRSAMSRPRSRRRSRRRWCRSR